ncbi:MAG: NAD-dependent epimerase/dehydratase family protein [Chloroflexota bacterium]
MKSVVAGGSGLIGCHLIPHLAAQGHEIVLLARWRGRRKRVLRKSRLELTRSLIEPDAAP